MKQTGSNEEIIQWVISKSTPFHIISHVDIRDYWVCGTDRITSLRNAAIARLKESVSEPAQAPSESAELSKSDGGLSAEVMFQTEQGA